MKAHVFDTYARTNDGKLLHFDILLAEQDETRAREIALTWLKSRQSNALITTLKECRFCHVETVDHAREQEIAEQGYSIIEISGFSSQPSVSP